MNPFTDPGALLRRHALHKAEEDLFAFSEQPLPSSPFPPSSLRPVLLFLTLLYTRGEERLLLTSSQVVSMSRRAAVYPQTGGGKKVPKKVALEEF